MIVFENDIYHDPLTGLPNFFKFIECDVESTFCTRGSFLIFDIIGFEAVNKAHGYSVGDLYLKTLSNTIRPNLLSHSRASVFRTDGDEFTVILPEVAYADADQLASRIRAAFVDALANEGLSHADVRALTLTYSDKIKTISQFYQIVLNHTVKNVKNCNESTVRERWLEHMIESFTRRIKDTLAIYNDAYSLAHTDDVSGLANHRAANRYLMNLVEKSKMNHEKFSLLFIDGDNLKRYNIVSYEHGNKMINQLSNIIAGSIRKDDKVFRWLSGDEFLVVLENVSHMDALMLAERVRTEVEIQTRDWMYPVTISIGVANFPRDGSDIKEVIAKAEKANSCAKNLGKNRIIQWSNNTAV